MVSQHPCPTREFHVGKTTARKADWKVCLVIQDILINCCICLVNPQEMATGFHCMGFSNSVVLIYSTHIPILCPGWASPAFTNCKGYFYVVLPGVLQVDTENLIQLTVTTFVLHNILETGGEGLS